MSRDPSPDARKAPNIGSDAWRAFREQVLPQLGLRPEGFARVHMRVRKKVLRRLRELSLDGLEAYRARLHGSSAEVAWLEAACRIVVSRFYRDPECFTRLRAEVLPRLAARALVAGRASVTAWCAGCASGEEAWTLRVLWDECVARQFPAVTFIVLGTDADERLLDRARAAVYPRSSLRTAPDDWQVRVFTKAGDTLQLHERHRHDVTFARQDLRHEMPDGPFDLILCRNVAFTYFDDAAQHEVARALRARLVAGGEIIVGAHESMPRERA